ncbi:MAG: hypothetical protein LBC37_08065 [Zoogloeaceae bacterium]|jgi:hypothetical protein|nr:hypothetical protein [Zoogloeaceae bacterium]
MSRFLNYIIIDDAGGRERITAADIDTDAAPRIVETLASVSCGERIHIQNGYTVSGTIGGSRALLTLHDEAEAVAVVGVCIKSRAGPPLWRFLRANAVNPAALPQWGCPASPWVALRRDVPKAAIPGWVEAWAKNVGWALMHQKTVDMF